MSELFGLIKDILTSAGGSFAFVLALLLGAGWLVHWVTLKISNMQTRHDTFTEDVKEIKADLKDMQKNVYRLEAKIDNLQTGSAKVDPLVQAHSPLAPNEAGRRTIEELGLNDMIARNADNIIRYIEDHIGSRNPYDIQKYCIDTASIEPENLLNNEDLDRIKLYAYNHGKSLFYYGALIGVLIRDLYFSRKGIDVNEVDRHDPTLNVANE